MTSTLQTGREFRTEHKSQFVTISIKGGVLMVRPAGPTLAEREAMIIAGDVRTMIAACGKSLRKLLLDVSDVRMMSSFGLGMCIDLRNIAHRGRAGTVLYGMSQELEQLIRMMKVERLYTIARSPQELVAALRA